MKERKIQLIIGNHAHVPLGSPESEFENIYENKMRPFISNLYRYSNIQAVLHYSGVLLHWIERTHPEFFMLIEDMVAKKQAEILTGGFYEPMFPLLPLQDRIGQIEHLTTYLRKHFGKRPAGCWIPFMAWEQNMVSSLCASGMNYTFLSKDQFVQAGLTNRELFAPCISEDQGKLINIIPVDKFITKELEEKSFSYVFNEYKNMIEEKYASVQEKIIVSVFLKKVSSSAEEAPDTAWNRFFEEITLSENFVETVLPSKILRGQKYFKKASFQDSTSFGNGYLPRRYIIDNFEANGIYSKMIFTNVLINQLKGDKSRKQNAREELWKAQDSFLFTPFNKFYHEIVKSAYSSLIRAEQLTREKDKLTSSLVMYDFDFDGINEFLFQDSKINCYVQLKGASVFELDYIPKAWNYIDSGASVSFKETRNAAFADAIVPPETRIQNLEKNSEINSRLIINEQFEALAQSKKGTSCFKLSPAGADIPYADVEIVKCYSIKKDVLNISYTLKNTGKERQDFCLVTEQNFSFEGESEDHVRFHKTDVNGKDIPTENLFENTSFLKILDVKNEAQILFNSSKIFSGCLVHIRDNNLYRATQLKILFPISLESNESWNNEFSLKFTH